MTSTPEQPDTSHDATDEVERRLQEDADRQADDDGKADKPKH